MLNVGMTLIQLAFVSVVMAVALEVIFETKLYQNNLGKGQNGNGSKFFSTFELRPWISMVVGVLLAFWFGLMAIKSGLGSEFLSSSGEMGPNAKHLDMLLTGLILGGGPKAIKKMGKYFSETKKAINI